jgi:Na+/melibiose symporter-like transporter
LRRRFPLFDVRVLARPAVAGAAVAILSTYVAFLGTMFLLPQYLQYVHDRSVVVTGLLLTPIGIGAGAAARYNARVAAALGPRVTIAAGSLALAASMALFLLLSETTSVLVVMVGAGLIGALISITIPAATTVIMNDVGEDRAGDGGAVNQLARQVGGALGVAIVGTVFAAVYTNRVDERLTDLTGARRERAADSIEEARDVIDTVPAGLRDRVTDQIDQAFDVAARAGFATCVAILLVAAAVSALTLPSRPYAPS